MKTLGLKRHRPVIEQIVQHYVRAEVVLVPDIAAWMESNTRGTYSSADHGNPIGISLWGSSVGAPDRILLRTPLVRQRIEDHLFALYLMGFKSVYERVQDSLTFAKHLVLHEVAHVKHKWGQDRERDCDKWAFKELNKWA